MADKKEETKSPLQTFKENLADKKNLTSNLTEGIKSTNAKVRSLAIKLALKTQEHDFVKKNIIPLIETDKSKKVLRAIAKAIHREKLLTKLETLTVKKDPTKKAEKAEAAPAGEPPKA